MTNSAMTSLLVRTGRQTRLTFHGEIIPSNILEPRKENNALTTTCDFTESVDRMYSKSLQLIIV